MVGLSATKPSPPPGFLLRRVYGYRHPAELKTKPVKGWRSSLLANSHPYLVPICVCGRPPAVGLLFIRRLVGGICTPATIKPFILQNILKALKKNSEHPLRGSTSCAAALRRAAHRMIGLGQCLPDPQSLMKGGKPRGNLPGSDCGSVCRGGAEV